jgi:hypothetical protein
MKLFYIIAVFFFLLSAGCDFKDSKLVIRNDTDSTVVVLIDEPNYYPTTAEVDTVGEKKINDSLLNTKAKITYEGQMRGVHFVLKHSSQNIGAFNTTWEGIIERMPKQRIEFFFFSPRVFDSGIYTWKDIWRNKMYLQKKDFSEKELKKNDWVVSFDGK